MFDLGYELFCEILLQKLPSYTSENADMVWICVFVYENSIAGFQKGTRNGQINIWVMKEYGVASLWKKFKFSHQCPSLGMLKPWAVGLRRNGEVVLENDKGGLILWNPNCQKIKNLEIIGYHYTFVVSYVESLALLDKAANDIPRKHGHDNLHVVPVLYGYGTQIRV